MKHQITIEHLERQIESEQGIIIAVLKGTHGFDKLKLCEKYQIAKSHIEIAEDYLSVIKILKSFVELEIKINDRP